MRDAGSIARERLDCGGFNTAFVRAKGFVPGPRAQQRR
jgi:hypothetical protein